MVWISLSHECVSTVEVTLACYFYKAFYGIGQVKFPYSGLIIGSSHFTLLPRLPLKMMLNLQVVKIDSKIVISLHESKSSTHTFLPATEAEEKNVWECCDCLRVCFHFQFLTVSSLQQLEFF